jgi:hypothetical protein
MQEYVDGQIAVSLERRCNAKQFDNFTVTPALLVQCRCSDQEDRLTGHMVVCLKVGRNWRRSTWKCSTTSHDSAYDPQRFNPLTHWQLLSDVDDVWDYSIRHITDG